MAGKNIKVALQITADLNQARHAIQGLNQDLSRINEDRDLADTIDLTEIAINHIDLSNMGQTNTTSGLSRRDRVKEDL